MWVKVSSMTFYLCIFYVKKVFALKAKMTVVVKLTKKTFGPKEWRWDSSRLIFVPSKRLFGGIAFKKNVLLEIKQAIKFREKLFALLKAISRVEGQSLIFLIWIKVQLLSRGQLLIVRHKHLSKAKFELWRKIGHVLRGGGISPN